jgi:diguanylate cyclase (GGDEF)-like protein/PAS domain S-box-containing protein
MVTQSYCEEVHYTQNDADFLEFVSTQIALAIERKRTDEALRSNEARFHNLFEYSPISMWEEDFSEVKQYLEDLKQEGITDFAAYFKRHPKKVKECFAKVKIIDVNEAALKLFHAESKQVLIKNIDQIFGTNVTSDLVKELVNIATGMREFEWEGLNNTVEGESIIVNIHWSAGFGYEETLEKVIVAIEDITPRKRAEEKLNYRSRADELLTKISTQFINLTSGDMDREIDGALKTIGQFENIERITVFRFDNQWKTITVTNEWCGDGVSSIKKNYQNAPNTAGSLFPDKYSDQPIVITRKEDLPAESTIARELFVSQNLKFLLIYPMRVNQKHVGFVCLETIHSDRKWDQDSILMLQPFVNILSNAFERSRLLTELENRAIRDELTGALNRRGFLEFAKIELNRASRFGRPTGVILFDIDHFKQINDSLGHSAGDLVIKEVVKCSLNSVRQVDLVGRWGGDEFVILLPETDTAGTLVVANRLCKAVENQKVMHGEKPVLVTISIGAAVNDKTDFSADELICQADQALYSAKEAGRNCVRFAADG